MKFLCVTLSIVTITIYVYIILVWELLSEIIYFKKKVKFIKYFYNLVLKIKMKCQVSLSNYFISIKNKNHTYSSFVHERKKLWNTYSTAFIYTLLKIPISPATDSIRSLLYLLKVSILIFISSHILNQSV